MRLRIVLAAIVVFLAFGGLFLFLSRHDAFPDPDAFYHVKASELLAERGIEKQFPWLSFTTLNESYADQHFLYHAALIPFVRSGADPLRAAKTATAIFAALLFSALAVFLLVFRVRLWWLFLLVLVVTNPFLFRILLVKAPALSLALLFLGVGLLFAGKRWLVFAVAFVYSWTYGGFALLAVASACYTVVASIRLRTLSWRAARLCGFVFSGLVLGVVLNPYFPQNLSLYWQQLVQIGVVNYQRYINVGGEWHPYAFVDLFSNAAFVSIGIIVAWTGMVLHRRRMTNETWTMALLTLFTLLITLKSRRYVEVYVPVAVVFAALAVRDAWPDMSFRKLLGRLSVLFRKRVALVAFAALYFVSATSVVVFRDLRGVSQDLSNGSSFDTFQKVGAWLRENTPEHSVVVHSDWDDFPALWYWNTWNRYIVGLDPTFMFLKDRNRYERWATLTMGQRTDDATTIITRDLQSRIVIVTKDHVPFKETMDAQQQFERVYEDDEVFVYEMRNHETLPDTTGI